jgi:tetratricopeptide (TPR) repeat protein
MQMLAQGRTGWKVVISAGVLACVMGQMVGCQSNPVLRKHGMDAYEDGQYDHARAKFTQALSQKSSDWKSHYYLGLVALKQGQPLEAQLSLERALSVRDNHLETPEILDALAQALLEQGKFENLTAMLQQAADRYGATHDYIRQATFLGKSGDVDGAKLAFQKAVRFALKDDPAPFIAMADFYDSLGASAEALLALRQAYYITPDNPRIAERIRQHGMVPGPTVAIEPQR